MAIPSSERKTPLVVAHRGASRLEPENTLAAIQSAVDSGASLVEIDIQQTRDDVLVLMHDATVDRTTNGTGAVDKLTWAEVGQLDASRGLRAGLRVAGRPEPVPTLEAALRLATRAGATLVIEVKHPERYPGIIAHLVELLDAADARANAIVASFDHRCLEELHRRAPDVRIDELWIWPVPGARSAAYTSIVSMYWTAVLVDPTFVRRAHRAGRCVWVWTVENPRIMRLMRRLGADGIITSNLTDCLEILRR